MSIAFNHLPKNEIDLNAIQMTEWVSSLKKTYRENGMLGVDCLLGQSLLSIAQKEALKADALASMFEECR